MIKKIGIITFHNAINYGAVLQTYALQKTIEKTGNICFVINYECKKIKNDNKIKIKSNNMKKFLSNIFYLPFQLIKRVKFINFKKRSLRLTRKIKNIQYYNNYFDIFITGSDQVWNYHHTDFDKVFFLDFVDDNNKKFSYAASFGFDKLSQGYKNQYKELLNNFNKISVREKAGKKILKELGIEATEVLDPTLLLDKNEWINLMNRKEKKIIQTGDYILVYSSYSELLKDFVLKLSEKTNCKILDLSFTIKSLFNKKFISIAGIGPNEFLSLFYHAKHIVTNTFHGTAFAINFNKPFFVIFLKTQYDTNSRLENILDLFDLKGRIIEEGKNIDDYEPIDYNKVNSTLQREREKSLAFLKSIIHEN